MAKRPLILCLALLFVPSFIAADRPLLFVQRVVDGDTLVLSTNEKVRLIGVDTPESHQSRKLKAGAKRAKLPPSAIQSQGKRAALFSKNVIEKRSVWLVYESGKNAGRTKDRYGRTLAYVYFEPIPCEKLEHGIADEICELDSFDEGFFNALLIEAGYATAYTRFKFKHMEKFKTLEKKAREEKRGFWKTARPLT